MARRRASRTRAIVRTVRAPSPVIRVSAPASIQRRRKRRGGGRRRSGIGGGLGVPGGSHTMYALGGAALLGYAEKTGVKIPILFGLSPAASAALIAWGLHRFARVSAAGPMFTGMASVAINRWASGTVPGGAVIGDGNAVFFDDDVEGVE